jgi:hypothetical protein
MDAYTISYLLFGFLIASGQFGSLGNGSEMLHLAITMQLPAAEVP